MQNVRPQGCHRPHRLYLHVFGQTGAILSFACVFDWILHLNYMCVVCFHLSFNAFSTNSLVKMTRLAFGFSSWCSLAGCRGIPLSISLFNRLGFRGVLHKAWASTVGVGVSGVSAKFSKSSQCVSQWQHMLESLQGKSRMHKHTRNWTQTFLCTSKNTWPCSIQKIYRPLKRTFLCSSLQNRWIFF